MNTGLAKADTIDGDASGSILKDLNPEFQIGDDWTRDSNTLPRNGQSVGEMANTTNEVASMRDDKASVVQSTHKFAKYPVDKMKNS